jgi:hypothetical protein
MLVIVQNVGLQSKHAAELLLGFNHYDIPSQ